LVGKGKHIAILGAGESGVGTAFLAKKQGWTVFVSDRGKVKEDNQIELINLGVEWEQGTHSVERILSADLIVKYPGIPSTVSLIQQAKNKGIPVISEIEFAGYYSNAKTICITGSNGKTTTTMLTYHILKKAGIHVGLAGNVGKSFARQVAENDFEWYVLELSSFQLDDMFEFRAFFRIRQRKTGSFIIMTMH
jgi:UDP-N-acetylmuramoylalanine--D-glutamate ligase